MACNCFSSMKNLWLKRSVQLNSFYEKRNTIILEGGRVTIINDAHGSNVCQMIINIGYTRNGLKKILHGRQYIQSHSLMQEQPQGHQESPEDF